MLSRKFDEKVLFITGASSGIGQKFVTEMTKLHPEALFFCVGRNLKKLDNSLSDVSCFVETKTWQCDLTSRQSVADAVAECLRYFGKIDEVLHFAGVSCWSSYEDSTNELFERLMLSNFYSTNNLLSESLSQLRLNKGKFFATTSVQGVIGAPYHAAYTASKHATEGLIKSVDIEEPLIDFHVIRPSWVSGTNMKSNALGSTGDKLSSTSHRTEKKGNATSLESAVEKILQYIRRPTSRPLYIPGKYALLPTIQSIVPGFLKRVIKGKFK